MAHCSLKRHLSLRFLQKAQPRACLTVTGRSCTGSVGEHNQSHNPYWWNTCESNTVVDTLYSKKELPWHCYWALVFSRRTSTISQKINTRQGLSGTMMDQDKNKITQQSCRNTDKM